MKFRLALFVLLIALWPAPSAPAQEEPQRIRVAVLDMGGTPLAARVTKSTSKLLASFKIKGVTLALLDREMSAAAARGVGYEGSLNLTLAEARSLGAAVGCDFYLTGDVQTVRRSASARPVYFESYASLFVVSSRTGRLVHWARPAAEADTVEEAEASLLAKLESVLLLCTGAVLSASAREERERFAAEEETTAAVIDLSTDESAAAHRDLREPAPYRRLRPAYTDAASRAEAEATVDALVEIGADGEVADVRVVRWAGFGLDEEVVETVRRMHFRPAEREGAPVPVRVLLRYNFRKPSKS